MTEKNITSRTPRAVRGEGAAPTPQQRVCTGIDADCQASQQGMGGAGGTAAQQASHSPGPGWRNLGGPPVQARMILGPLQQYTPSEDPAVCQCSAYGLKSLGFGQRQGFHCFRTGMRGWRKLLLDTAGAERVSCAKFCRGPASQGTLPHCFLAGLRVY